MKKYGFHQSALLTTLWLAVWSGSLEGCSSSDGGAGDAASGGRSPAAGAGGTTSGGAPVLTFGGRTESGAGGEAGEDDQCGGQEVRAAPVNVNLLFVIDRSESMTGLPEGFTRSKWLTTISALEESLDAIRGKLAVGLQFFPDPSESSADVGCGMPSGDEIAIPIAAEEEHVDSIVEALGDATPGGSTPAAAALALALEYFTNGEGAALEGKRHVLLALDGGPNCNPDSSCGADTAADRALCTLTYDKPDSCGENAPFNCCSGQPEGCLDADRVTDQVDALREAGVTTLVVGMPGSESYGDVLDSLAEAGGLQADDDSPKYYKVADPDAVREALASLPFELIRSCELELEKEPPNTDEVNVYLDGAVVPKEGEDGWELDSSTTPSTVRLKGATCAHVETRGATSIRVEFGCPTVFVPR